MSLHVLKTHTQVRDARRQLESRRLSSVDGWMPRTLARLGLRERPIVGDVRKSWDVLQTVDYLGRHLGRDDLIVDIGARGSEMLPVLARMGYTNLVGFDLDPRVLEMPRLSHIDYRVGNFMHTDLPDASCGAVTAISVIEHGYDPHGLFSEVSRLLRPGGHFVASFDYWPEKLRTEGRTLFGMTWRIFSADEVAQMIADAARYRLRPAGDVDTQARAPLVHFEGYDYTFAWLALTRE